MTNGVENYLRLLGLGTLQSRTLQLGGRPVTIHARELSADQVENLFVDLRDADGMLPKEAQRELRNRIVAAAICDELGIPQLKPQQVGALPYSLLTPMASFALEVNGLSDPDETTEKKD